MLDVTLICIFTTICTLTSILEQIHYATSFREIKQAEYENALKSLKTITFGYNDSPQIVDTVFFWIRKHFSKRLRLRRWMLAETVLLQSSTATMLWP